MNKSKGTPHHTGPAFQQWQAKSAPLILMPGAENAEPRDSTLLIYFFLS